jgi:thiamine-phosphate pyrophosphorylase
MMTLPDYGLYVITDCENLTHDELIKKTESILQSGAAMLQYRNKKDKLSTKEIQAIKLQQLCRDYSVPFIINDDIRLAQKINADGVHLGRDDKNCKVSRKILGPDYIIGITCYNEIGLALEAVISGANYVAFGAFFPTTSKSATSVATTALLRQAKQQLQLPIVAIGGITPENGKELIHAGADFFAVISGVYEAADPAIATRAYLKLFDCTRK